MTPVPLPCRALWRLWRGAPGWRPQYKRSCEIEINGFEPGQSGYLWALVAAIVLARPFYFAASPVPETRGAQDPKSTTVRYTSIRLFIRESLAIVEHPLEATGRGHRGGPGTFNCRNVRSILTRASPRLSGGRVGVDLSPTPPRQWRR